MTFEHAPKAESLIEKIGRESKEAGLEFLKTNQKEIVFSGSINRPDSPAAKALDKLLQDKGADSGLYHMVLNDLISEAGSLGYTITTEKKPDGETRTILKKA